VRERLDRLCLGDFAPAQSCFVFDFRSNIEKIESSMVAVCFEDEAPADVETNLLSAAYAFIVIRDMFSCLPTVFSSQFRQWKQPLV
jgi:hypothetical protein